MRQAQRTVIDACPAWLAASFPRLTLASTLPPAATTVVPAPAFVRLRAPSAGLARARRDDDNDDKKIKPDSLAEIKRGKKRNKEKRKKGDVVAMSRLL